MAEPAVLSISDLVVDFSTAANVLSQLHLSGGEAVMYLAVTALVLPNAALFSGSYLLGPGFTDLDCESLRQKLELDSLLVTRGNKGMLLTENGRDPLTILEGPVCHAGFKRLN